MGVRACQEPRPNESNALHVGILEDFPDLGPEARADSPERTQRQIGFAPLQRAVVGAMHADLVGKILLTHAQGLPAPAQGVSEAFRESTILHEIEPYGSAS